MTTTLFVLTHEATFVAFAVFAILVGFNGARTWLGGLLFASIVTTALWAQGQVAIATEVLPLWYEGLLTGLRDGAWIGLCLAIISRRGGRSRQWFGLVALSVALLSVQIGLDISGSDAGVIAGVHIDGPLLRVAVTILGLVLVENILRNTSRSEFWSLKHLLIGLLAVLLFQLFSRVPEFLTHSQDVNVLIARPLVYLLALPLFVVSSIRFPNLSVRVHSSRGFVFHSATLIAAGVMLQGLAIAAWYVKTYGGSNGTVLAITIVFGGTIAIGVALVSGRVRSRIRRFINENFFSLKYDYRVEWEKVIRALSLNPELGSADRVLRALCDLLDSPGGVLWIHRRSWHQYMVAAKIGVPENPAPFPETDARIRSVPEEQSFGVVDMSSDWSLLVEAPWLVIPLKFRSDIIGFAVLTQPRAPKKLDWEDEGLVRLVGLQLAAYLVQEETAQALADARQLEEFNRRFAFAVHDIKNTIGQLSLLVKNAGQFGHVPEFREDMVVTLKNAVDRLQELLRGLTTVGSEHVPGHRKKEVIDLIEFLEEFSKRRNSLGQALTFDAKCPSLSLELRDVSGLRRVLEHVVSNAYEASPDDKPVELSVSEDLENIEINVLDHGTGMTEKFILEELFRPLRTTKAGGFGIGAYQARELMRDLGGDILVTSKIGIGTNVKLILPRLTQ